MLKKLLLSITIALVLLSSCTVTQTFVQKSNNSGSSLSDIQVNQFFLNVLDDFSSFSSTSDYSVMDDAMLNFASKVNSSSHSSSVILQTDGESKRYIMGFDYSSLSGLIEDLNNGKSNTILSMDSSSISFNLDINNYEELESVIPFLSDPNFEVYGPRYSYGMSEEEYYDMISFLLGEDGPASLKESYVYVEINTPGNITYIEGATKTNSQTALFTFKVIDFLLLNNPLSFKVQWED